MTSNCRRVGHLVTRMQEVFRRCEVRGTVNRHERQVQFTEFTIHAHVMLVPGTSADLAERVLEKSKDGCLIANSLKAASRLEIQIETVALPQTA
jgi:uncharacterized OsmC-like protein